MIVEVSDNILCINNMYFLFNVFRYVKKHSRDSNWEGNEIHHYLV